MAGEIQAGLVGVANAGVGVRVGRTMRVERSRAGRASVPEKYAAESLAYSMPGQPMDHRVDLTELEVDQQAQSCSPDFSSKLAAPRAAIGDGERCRRPSRDTCRSLGLPDGRQLSSRSSSSRFKLLVSVFRQQRTLECTDAGARKQAHAEPSQQLAAAEAGVGSA